MGFRTMEGNVLVGVQRVTSRNFDGWVPASILRFEERVLAREFPGETLTSWESNARYHAYLNVSVLCPPDACTLDAAYREYLHWPAPTMTGRRPGPVREGDRSIAATTARGVTGLPLFLPGGFVVHYVESAARALANATTSVHLLHPGYIIRWVSAWGPALVSNTLGRGIGRLPEANIIYGARMFHELDQQIKARLPESVHRPAAQ
jgi:hypothetical protein